MDIKEANRRLQPTYMVKKHKIKERMQEFREVYHQGDEAIFIELCYCIFTAGATARMGLISIEAVKDIILTGTADEIEERLEKKHRYPKARAEYIVHTRDFFQSQHDMQIMNFIESFDDRMKLRHFFAASKGIKGIGYKESSHFFRNIGFKGYAILDRHILRSLHEFKVISSPDPPKNRRMYLAIEARMKEFAKEINIDFDDLDLLLWSNRTGEILK